MSYKGREIEVKLRIQGVYLGTIAELLRLELPVSKSVYDSSTDTYWHLRDPGVRGDFIRMRELGTTVQVTVKGKDKGNNTDRIEVELETFSSKAVVRGLLTAAHGRPAGKITKTYHVFWLVGESEHTNVSCYAIEGDEQDVYIEIESTGIDTVLELEAKVRTLLDREDIQVERAQGSLYELYITPWG